MTEHRQESETAESAAASETLGYAGWVRALKNGDLVGQECGSCGHVTAAPKAACARCGSQELTSIELPTAGTVYTETTVSVAPTGFDDSYQVALVDLGDAQVMCHIDGSVEIGQDVALAEPIEVEGAPAPVFQPA